MRPESHEYTNDRAASGRRELRVPSVKEISRPVDPGNLRNLWPPFNRSLIPRSRIVSPPQFWEHATYPIRQKIAFPEESEVNVGRAIS